MYMPPRTATAAVAIIKTLLPRESFLILRRAAHPQDPWSGHFSFPGGRKEPWDSNLLDTCIRETHEETGIMLHPTQLQRKLPLEPAGRNFDHPLWVQPFLFSLPFPPYLQLESKEIESGCWLDIKNFRKADQHRSVEMLPGRFFPAYPLEDYFVWGFTYRLLCTLLGMNGMEK